MYSTPHLVSDTLPPSQVGPGGGATIFFYKAIYRGPMSLHLSLVFWAHLGSCFQIPLPEINSEFTPENQAGLQDEFSGANLRLRGL